MNRDYVIVCNEHSGHYPGYLLFWGKYTKDEEKRSFGGYTSDLDNCEKYTLEEIKKKGYDFPVYNKRMTLRSFMNHEDVVIKIEELKELGYITKRFVIKP